MLNKKIDIDDEKEWKVVAGDVEGTEKVVQLNKYEDNDYHWYDGGDEAEAQREKYKEEWENYSCPLAEEKDEDGNMINPIMKERGCTDPQCILLFWAFVAAMIYCVNYGYTNGDFH